MLSTYAALYISKTYHRCLFILKMGRLIKLSSPGPSHQPQFPTENVAEPSPAPSIGPASHNLECSTLLSGGSSASLSKASPSPAEKQDVVWNSAAIQQQGLELSQLQPDRVTALQGR